MKTIDVYKIIETSYRYGDVQTKIERCFSTPELRDEYHDKILRKSYLDDDAYMEIEDNIFEDKSEKWCYEIEKKNKILYIIEDLSEIE